MSTKGVETFKSGTLGRHEVAVPAEENAKENPPAYAANTVTPNGEWCANVQREDFETEDAVRCGSPSTVSTSGIVDHVHDPILAGTRISAETDAEILGDSLDLCNAFLVRFYITEHKIDQ